MKDARILLIHDVCLDHKMWDGYMGALEKVGEVIRYDLIGHGSTPHLSRPLHIDDFIRQARRELALAQADSAVVIGVGLGGLIAQAIAVEYGHQVAALALLSTPFKRNDKQVNSLLDAIMAAEIDPEDEEATGNALTPYVLPYRIFATHDSHLADRLKEIDCPVLIATGSLDNDARPASSKKLARALGTTNVQILDGEGSLGDAKNEKAVASMLSQFIRGI